MGFTTDSNFFFTEQLFKLLFLTKQLFKLFFFAHNYSNLKPQNKKKETAKRNIFFFFERGHKYIKLIKRQILYLNV
jgi:hypothetical protein